MPQSKKWSLPSQTPISQQLLDLYKKAAIVAAGALVVPTTLAIIGFAPAGVAAGELPHPIRLVNHRSRRYFYRLHCCRDS